MINIFAGNINDAQPLLNNVKIIKSSMFHQAIIKQCVFNNKNILVCGTGYGKANIGSCFGHVCSICPINTLICLGNCGAIRNCSNNANINNVAISTSTTQFDVDFSALGYPSPLIPGLNIAHYSSSDKLIKLAEISSHLRNINYNDGLFASGDQFVADNILSESISQNYNAQFIDNESGVLGELCCIAKIPFVSIKGISNYADNNASEDYQNNKRRANCTANEVVCTMLNLMTKSTC